MIASTITIIAQPYLLHFCALVMLSPIVGMEVDTSLPESMGLQKVMEHGDNDVSSFAYVGGLINKVCYL